MAYPKSDVHIASIGGGTTAFIVSGRVLLFRPLDLSLQKTSPEPNHKMWLGRVPVELSPWDDCERWLAAKDTETIIEWVIPPDRAESAMSTVPPVYQSASRPWPEQSPWAEVVTRARDAAVGYGFVAVVTYGGELLIGSVPGRMRCSKADGATRDLSWNVRKAAITMFVGDRLAHVLGSGIFAEGGVWTKGDEEDDDQVHPFCFWQPPAVSLPLFRGYPPVDGVGPSPLAAVSVTAGPDRLAVLVQCQGEHDNHIGLILIPPLVNASMKDRECNPIPYVIWAENLLVMYGKVDTTKAINIKNVRCGPGSVMVVVSTPTSDRVFLLTNDLSPPTGDGDGDGDGQDYRYSRHPISHHEPRPCEALPKRQSKLDTPGKGLEWHEHQAEGFAEVHYITPELSGEACRVRNISAGAGHYAIVSETGTVYVVGQSPLPNTEDGQKIVRTEKGRLLQIIPAKWKGEEEVQDMVLGWDFAVALSMKGKATVYSNFTNPYSKNEISTVFAADHHVILETFQKEVIVVPVPGHGQVPDENGHITLTEHKVDISEFGPCPGLVPEDPPSVELTTVQTLVRLPQKDVSAPKYQHVVSTFE